MRSWRRRITLLLGLIAAAWGGWWWIEERRCRSEVEQAAREIEAGRLSRARQRLVEVTRRRPGLAEAVYHLGRCEEALNHPEAALAAWSSIPAKSPMFAKAAIERAWLLIQSGRLGPAEEVLAMVDRAAAAGDDARRARDAREYLLRLEGRAQEARGSIVALWRGAPDPSLVLQRLYILDDAAFPLEHVKKMLDGGDPQDDRVWLGRANLSTWQGRFDEAARWLDACERLRPDDQPVWLSRLALAMAASDPAAACRAVEHLEASWFLKFEVLRLRVWFAGFLGDDEAERRCLGALLDEEPGNSSAWGRRAELAIRAGRGADADESRKRQAEAINLRERYADLLMVSADRSRHAAELARLARALGRPIEARGWSLIDAGRAGAEPLWHEAGADADSRVASPAGPLADLLGDVLPSPGIAQAQRPGAAVAAVTPAFVDDAVAAGLRFFHDNGHTQGDAAPPEVMCGGVGLLDYDGDGWIDVYAVQGGPFPPVDPAQPGGDRLFHNRGDGTFDDATERTGLAAISRGYGHGVAVGDFDNDGRPDLLVTRWRSYALYRNAGDGRFEDATVRAGLGGDRDWPTSAAFADLDGDGDLDLYVCHYLVYDPSDPLRCGHIGAGQCMPRSFLALPDHVFRNDGGRFVDVTAQAGFVDPDGRGMGVVAANLDDDNKIDLYVSNDMSANYLFHNLGGFRFEEIGQLAGAAAATDGLYKSGMGVACGDLDGDGRLDLAVTNFFGESTTFYRNLGQGLFGDHTAGIGLLAPSRPLLGFGIALADMNNDGRLDLLATNGHVYDARPKIPWTMPPQLLVRGPDGRLIDISDRAGEPFRQSHLGRGLAVGDIDNDGRRDAIVLNQNEPLAYLHNQTEGPGHFIRFHLEGTRSNRDAVGARVTIACGGRRLLSERVSGGSYQSANDPRLHFGLGTSRSVDSVEVRWPSGRVDRYQGLGIDREYRLREGAKPREENNNPRDGRSRTSIP